jgi:ABC-type antimicrobial peptide transport system permease subunit
MQHKGQKIIGIRKTIGSSRRQLIIRILSETFLLTLAATLLSVVLTPMLLKAFSGFIPEGLHFSLSAQPIRGYFSYCIDHCCYNLSGF